MFFSEQSQNIADYFEEVFTRQFFTFKDDYSKCEDDFDFKTLLSSINGLISSIRRHAEEEGIYSFFDRELRPKEEIQEARLYHEVRIQVDREHFDEQIQEYGERNIKIFFQGVNNLLDPFVVQDIVSSKKIINHRKFNYSGEIASEEFFHRILSNLCPLWPIC